MFVPCQTSNVSVTVTDHSALKHSVKSSSSFYLLLHLVYCILTLLILITGTLYISKKIPAHTRATQDPGTFTQIFFILWTMVILRAMDCQCCQDRNDVWRVCLFHYYCPRAPLSFSDRIQWLVQYF